MRCERGQSLQLTGDVTNNGGVELVEPAPDTAVPPTTEAPTTEAPATEAPDVRATLSPNISGQTADQETCANGKQD